MKKHASGELLCCHAFVCSVALFQPSNAPSCAFPFAAPNASARTGRPTAAPAAQSSWQKRARLCGTRRLCWFHLVPAEGNTLAVSLNM